MIWIILIVVALIVIIAVKRLAPKTKSNRASARGGMSISEAVKAQERMLEETYRKGLTRQNKIDLASIVAIFSASTGDGLSAGKRSAASEVVANFCGTMGITADDLLKESETNKPDLRAIVDRLKPLKGHMSMMSLMMACMNIYGIFRTPQAENLFYNVFMGIGYTKEEIDSQINAFVQLDKIFMDIPDNKQ